MSKVVECSKCKNLFSLKGGNYKKHIKVCNGTYSPFVKQICCKYCDLIFDSSLKTSARANHTRWCSKNPKRDYYILRVNDTSQMMTEESINKKRKSISDAHKNGKYITCYEEKRGKPGKPHSEEIKQLLREKALSSSHRRLKRKMIDYNGILLDSSWELELAKRLDELKIKWNRPKPIKWVDNDNVIHNYFPDFYLLDYDLYLDPKNPQALKVQKNKIDKILEQYNNVIIIKTLNECKNFNIMD